MPTVLRIRGYRFYFFAEEGNEPAHVHADKSGGTLKIWLTNWSVASSEGLKPAEIRLALEIAQLLHDSWHAFHQRKS
jgi:hypothetical protein